MQSAFAKWLAGQTDYLHLLCSAAWLTAALMAREIFASDGLRSRGIWFFRAALAQAGAECVRLLQLSGFAPSILGAFELTALLVAAACWIELAFHERTRPAVRHLLVLILMCPALLGAASGLKGVVTVMELTLYLPAALLAAWALRKLIPVVAVALILYSLLQAAVQPNIRLWPVQVLPTASQFREALGVPFVAAAAAFVWILVFALAVRVCGWVPRSRVVQVRGFSKPCGMFVAVLIILSGGWIATNRVGRAVDADLRSQIRTRTELAAATIPHDWVLALTWSERDLPLPEYSMLKALLMKMRTANPDLRFVSLMGIRQGKSYVLVDSEPPDSPDYSPPGQYYEEADPEYNRLLNSDKSFTIGPLFDRWGVWVTGAAPVLRVSADAAVCLTLDVDARLWGSQIEAARLPIVLIVLLIHILTVASAAAIRRYRREAEEKSQLAARVTAQQQAVIKMALSPVMASGDFQAAARELTETVTQALNVARTSVWRLDSLRGELRCVDLYDVQTGSHSADAVLSIAKYPNYFKVIVGGRAVDAGDAQADPRTRELAESYFRPANITSTLDAPIRVYGKMVGIVCCEHVGPPRTWQPDEIRFAGEVADQAAQALVASERRALEERARQGQWMESLGILAGGLAHDFNNLLMPILAYADMLCEEIPKGSPLQEGLREIRQSAEKAASLCRQMLACAGRGRVAMEPLNLGALVREMTPVLHTAVAGRASLNYSLSENLPLVRADAAQMRQTILNLVLNAAEAIEESQRSDGEIAISVEERYCDEDLIRRCVPGTVLKPSKCVCLEVRDNGVGMSPQMIGRAFEPFFSTKFLGRGLGLSAVLGIVHSHGGAINVESELNRGTSFRVLLPTLIPSTPVTFPKSVLDWRGEGTVLVIEDEPAVLRALTEMLTRMGFAVLAAPTPAAGRELFEAHALSLRCAIIDLTMPGEKGTSLVAAFRQVRQDLPVVIVSGYEAEEVLALTPDRARLTFLHKPFSYGELVTTLRNLLGSG